MAKPTITRTIQLKTIKFKTNGKKDFTPPNIQDVLSSINASARTVGSRLLEHNLNQ
jgi:hypothetical protein